MRLRTARVLDRTRLGIRGAFLLGLALIDVVYGMGLLLPSDETQASSSYAWRQEFMPSEAWGTLWVAAGVLLFTQAWAVNDRAAYAVAIMVKLLWGVIAVGSWLLGPVAQGWQTASLFLGMAWCTLVVSLVSDRPAPPIVPIMKDDQGGGDR